VTVVQAKRERQVASRRDRVRAATTQEIRQTARRILVEQGPEAVSLRGIAREMGMTAPALYRYFGSHEELIRHVIADIFTGLAEELSEAISAADETPFAGGDDPPRPPATPGDMTEKIVAACRAFRRWALDHDREFTVLFGAPLPGLDDGRNDIADECALKFADTFFGLFLELWRSHPFPVPAPDEIDPGLCGQIARFRDGLGADIPIGAMLTFLRCWMRLYGAVSMEVFGHLGFALEDPAPMFEIVLAELAVLVGLEYPPAG
jgi:AcrR family transcriptional regulator